MPADCCNILLGKVRGTRMVDLSCINEKLIRRAVGILVSEFDCAEDEAEQLLKKHDFQLLEAIRSLE